MKGPAAAGAEIDLEIAAYQLKNQDHPTYQMQLPIWKASNEEGKNAIKLRKDGSEVSASTYNGCREDKSNPAMGAWGYTYEGYDPRQWIHYKLEWTQSHIKWLTANLERARFENKKPSTFPAGPLVSPANTCQTAVDGS